VLQGRYCAVVAHYLLLECVSPTGQLAPEDLVDEFAGLGEPRINDLPQHATVAPRAFGKTLAL
jgi:hypothetical protein